eukprot:NODE_9340_length_1431_cov_3.224693.p1 GENE.NODE_9340_length_1431_cov_3.224693~~NODE_9340_length_1431_cov_3.224693.p1  ORF type:complete len:428 (+),score=114.53 NODE_9340_length_1431_cov_3.224693:91-1284(+)
MTAPAANGTSTSANSNAFAHTLSLGSRCLVANTFRESGLRMYAGPFDWIYSSAEMVRHIIEDDFAAFLNLPELVYTGDAVGHRIYSEMLGRSVIFPHHDPRTKHRAQLVRQVERFRRILADDGWKLFVHCAVASTELALAQARSPEACGCSEAEVLQLFDMLRRRGAHNFELVSVRVAHGSASAAVAAGKALQAPITKHVRTLSAAGSTRLTMFELHCVGGSTGLRLKSPADTQALRQLFKKGRNFDVVPDPLGCDARLHGSSSRAISSSSSPMPAAAPTLKRALGITAALAKASARGSSAKGARGRVAKGAAVRAHSAHRLKWAKFTSTFGEASRRRRHWGIDVLRGGLECSSCLKSIVRSSIGFIAGRQRRCNVCERRLESFARKRCTARTAHPA